MFSAKPSRAKLDHTKDNEIFALFTFDPPKVAEKDRAPLDLALVLDISGSMFGDKLDYVRKSCVKLIELLKDKDVVSITAFESHVHDIAEPTNCTTEGRRKLIEKVNNLHTIGGTNLSGGLFKGLQYVAGASKTKGTVRKCLLFTDGQANEGEIDPDKLAKMALEVRQGTGISTFGYGHDYNADLLAKLAQNGGTYYIDSPDKILTAFGTELGGLVTTFAQNVEVFLKPGEDVKIAEVLNDLDVDVKDDGTVTVKCDDLLAESPYFVSVKLEVGARGKIFPRDTTLVTATAKYMNLLSAKLEESLASIKVRFVKAADADSEDDKSVMAEAAVFQVAQAQLKAINLANVGDFVGAQSVMRACADSVSVYCSTSANMARGSVQHLVSPEIYRSGGVQHLNSTRSALNKRYGGMRGQSLGGVELDAYASPGQAFVSESFSEPPSIPAPVVIEPKKVHIDPATTQGAKKSRSKKRW